MKAWPSFCLLLVLMPLTWRLDPPVKPDWSGYYVVNGAELSGDKYQGVASIQHYGDAYLCNFSVGSNNTTGIGQARGNVLAVAWTMTRKDVLVKGITTYTKKDGVLVGVWYTLPGDSKPRIERLSFLKAIED